MVIRLVVVSFFVFALGGGFAPTTAFAQEVVAQIEEDLSLVDGLPARRVTTRTEEGGRTREHSTVELPSINGGHAMLSAVEDEVVTIDVTRQVRTRREFVTDPNGRARLSSTIEERHVARPDGTRQVTRQVSEPDVNGRPRATRREEERTIRRADGVFRTTVEVAVPTVNGFIVEERRDLSEQRDGDRVLKREGTIYRSTANGAWAAAERRILTHDPDGEGGHTVELVYRADDAGTLELNDRIVSREWTTPGGRYRRSEETFSTRIPNEVQTSRPRLAQQVEVVRSERPGGGWSSVRTVRQPRGGRLEVVEEIVERATRSARATVIERERRVVDLNGRLETVSVTRSRETND